MLVALEVKFPLYQIKSVLTQTVVPVYTDVSMFSVTDAPFVSMQVQALCTYSLL